jgi:hypothetical protein
MKTSGLKMEVEWTLRILCIFQKMDSCLHSFIHSFIHSLTLPAGQVVL